MQSALGFAPLGILSAHDDVSQDELNNNVLRMAGSVQSAQHTKGVRTLLFTGVTSQIEVESLSRMLLEKLRTIGVRACRIETADLLLPVNVNRAIHPEMPMSSQVRSVPPLPEVSEGFVRANLAALQAKYTVVLIQASSLRDSAETEYVARCTDATILVAQCAVTTRAELLQAAEHLQRLQVPAIGVVLQGVRRSHKPKCPEAVDTFRVKSTQTRVLPKMEPVLDGESMVASVLESSCVIPMQLEQWQHPQETKANEALPPDPTQALPVVADVDLRTLERACEDHPATQEADCSVSSPEPEHLVSSALPISHGQDTEVEFSIAHVLSKQIDAENTPLPTKLIGQSPDHMDSFSPKSLSGREEGLVSAAPPMFPFDSSVERPLSSKLSNKSTEPSILNDTSRAKISSPSDLASQHQHGSDILDSSASMSSQQSFLKPAESYADCVRKQQQSADVLDVGSKAGREADELPVRAELSFSMLRSRSSEKQLHCQPETDISACQIKLETSLSPEEHHSKRKSTSPPSRLIGVRWNSSLSLHASYSAGQSSSPSTASIVFREHDPGISTSEANLDVSERLLDEREGMLTRPWNLLSQFCQTNHPLSKSPSPQLRGKVGSKQQTGKSPNPAYWNVP